MRPLILAALIAAVPLPLAAQTPATPPAPQASAVPQTGSAQAYYEFMLARHLESQDDLAGALEALKRAEAADPRSAEIQAEFAGFYARQNKGPEAVAAAERALKLDTKNAEARRILGLVYSAWSDGGVPPPPGRTAAQLRELAIEHLSAILDTPAMATDLNMQLTLARLMLRGGKTDRAVPILETIVSQAPFAPEPYALLGEARLALGRVDEGFEALEAAAELNPRYYVSLAEAYEKQRRWADAAGAYAKAVEGSRSPPRDVRLRWINALLNIPGGTGAPKARDLLKEYVAANPSDARAQMQLGYTHLQLNEHDLAIAAFSAVLQRDPQNAAVLNSLGYLLADRGQRLPEAIGFIERALKIEPDNPAYLDSLGWALFKNGRVEDAEAPLRKAAASAATQSVIHDHLGDVLARRGKTDEAIAAWQRALAGDGEDIDKAAIEKKIRDARVRKQ